jgi:hypothetical protein
MCTKNYIYLIVNILYITSLWYFLPSSGHLMVQGFLFEGELQFSKLFKMTICEGKHNKLH